MLKRLLCICLAVLMIVPLSSCGEEKTVSTEVNTEVNTSTKAETVAEVKKTAKYADGEAIIDLSGKWQTTEAGFDNNKNKKYYSVEIEIEKEKLDLLESIKNTEIDDYYVYVEFRNPNDIKLSSRNLIRAINGSNINCTGDDIRLIRLNDSKNSITIEGYEVGTLLKLKVVYIDPILREEQLQKSEEKIKEAFEKGNGNGITLEMPAKRTSFSHKTIQGVECYDVHGYYVPVILGYPKMTEKEVKKLYDSNPTGEELQEKISNIGDWINYVYLCKWPHNSANNLKTIQKRGNGGYFFWQYTISGKQIVEQRGGGCGASATAFAYILKDDYEEIGYIYKKNHFFCYVKNGDKYYMINPADWDVHVFARGTNWSTGYYSGYQNGKVKIDLPIVCDDLQELADDMKNKGVSDLMYSCVACGTLIPLDRNWGFAPKGSTIKRYNGIEIQYKDYNLYTCGDFTDWNVLTEPSIVQMTVDILINKINPDSNGRWLTRQDYYDSYGTYMDNVRW